MSATPSNLLLTALLVSTTLTLGTMSGSLTAKESYYYWLDKNNVPQFTEIPPEAQEAVKQRIENKASSSQSQEMKKLQLYRDKVQEQREATNKKTKAATKPNTFIEQQCQQARSNLKAIKKGGRIREKNPHSGELNYLEADAIDQKRTEALAYLKKYCAT